MLPDQGGGRRGTVISPVEFDHFLGEVYSAPVA
jgi:hypothetical protein